jgi:oxygen-dependent protoporphyrinogen oxidase
VVRWKFVTKTKVAIIGGGISGLSAAYALHKRQVPYLLLEAGTSLGGLIRAETRDGFLLESADSMHAGTPAGIALCRELGLGERLVPANPDRPSVSVLHRGRLHPLPEGMMLGVPTRILPFAKSGLFSWPGKLRMGLDLVLPAGNGRADESIASFLRRRFGQEAVQRLGEPLLAGIHSGDPERLSILATFPRLREIAEKNGSLVRGMWATAAPKPAPGTGRPAAFYSLRGGLREMVDALVVRLERGRIWTKAAVHGLSRANGSFSLAVEGGETVSADRVVVAAPGPKIAPALEGLVPGAARALAAIPFASTATVFLGYRRADVAHPLDGYGLVVPQAEGLRTTALTFVSTKYPFRAPEGRVLLRGTLGGVRDPDAMNLTDEQMVETVKRDMAGVLGLRGQPVMSRVFRWPAGLPQLEVGHLERMAAVEKEVAAVPGLHLTGGGIRTTGVPDAVADGTRAGEAVAGEAR